jgi:two-component system phosphate regulon sensor histidine kinase PhoR
MALAALDQAQREFVLIASHELRTPLAVITGYASMLGDGSLGQLPPPVADAVAVMAAKLAEMGSLVERMLHVARIDEGLEAVRSDRVDMAQAAREAVERIRAAVDFRQGRIALEAPAEPALAEADPQAVALVFDLLQNATKFTLAPPDIRIRLSNGDGVRLEVADSGVGIPADAQARLFEKFFRADHPELRHVGGTGLGLYLVKRLVEAMGGSISFISTPGEGTTFVVALKPASTAALAIPDC